MTRLDRRQVIKSAAGAATLAGLAPFAATARASDARSVNAGWRSFEIITRLDIGRRGGATQAWVPLPAFDAPTWFRPAGSTWTTNAETAAIKRDGKYGAELLHIAWAAGQRPALVEVTSRFATRDRMTDFSQPGPPARLSPDELRLYTAATELIPVDGIVKETADGITDGSISELEKSRRLYSWTVENAFRDRQTRGCGLGDVARMLKSGRLGGKSADITALFVGLTRASGLPARIVYGLRVAKSNRGYASLGAASEVVTKAQHCRAEVHLADFGWVPFDPSDVRTVALEEPPGNRPMADAKVVEAQGMLYGGWEMNWLAYNAAHDITLPGSQGPPLGFLMYPQAEVAGVRIDCLDPDAFSYQIVSREIGT